MKYKKIHTTQEYGTTFECNIRIPIAYQKESQMKESYLMTTMFNISPCFLKSDEESQVIIYKFTDYLQIHFTVLKYMESSRNQVPT